MTIGHTRPLPPGAPPGAGLPPGFVLGVTSTAASVEGDDTAGGRTPSVWDVVALAPGRIADGSTPAVGAALADHWPGDLALLTGLGVPAFRMSLSWSRLQPGGRGSAAAAGVEYYDRMLDSLLAAGIAPWVTLLHWDLPLELMQEGGWLARDTASAFAEYAALAAERFGDRVAAWITHDEAVLHTAYGYAVGIDAPGLTLLGSAFATTHHQLLGHGLAVAALRAGSGAPVGIANHHTAVAPATGAVADRGAARWYDGYHNRQFTDPLFLGRYPGALLRAPGVDESVVQDGDLAVLAAPLDFYGVGYYSPTTVTAVPENRSVPFSLDHPADAAHTDNGHPVDAAGLTTVLTDLTARYPALPPLVVTGNGAAFDDRPDPAGGQRDDRARIAFLDDHLAAVVAARAAGADVRGYFHRSLLDGWEFADGHTARYGLVAVDRADLSRRPRASFHHYADLVRRHRATHPTGPGPVWPAR
ncbi:family 1 glycosylhydrolase [Nakamurella flavida]|uniref:Family 1 glycosylhydrolase n=1 Tax=Nakamurella flavida TaxID=363630 RepID=A0A939C3J4_9ACTN|nr:family 1 glycosylhydrolase [Nakamurella flavida]MBM9477720.1 family 1 glycosylhydrolase [Nakamurella flavida]MDP9779272.1 beta-glucosidase [Nakamurella flavida]